MKTRLQLQLLITVPLILGYKGLVVELKSPPDSDERARELLELMADTVDTGDEFVPPGMLQPLEGSICAAVLSLDRRYRFDHVIPVRRATERSRYMDWDSEEHKWAYRQFNPKIINLKGERAMLVIQSPQFEI
jgi:hypothetical protein